jgi:uncharacterized protein (DUF4415 family)
MTGNSERTPRDRHPTEKPSSTDWAKVDAHVITQQEYEEVPELDDDFFERAEFSIGGRVVRPGRPPAKATMCHVSIRLSADVLAHFKAGGPGWQTRIDEALKRVVVQERAARSVALDAEERAAKAAAKTAAE